MADLTVSHYEQKTTDGVHRVRNVSGLILIATRHNLSTMGGLYIKDESTLEQVLTHIAEMFEEHQKIATAESGRSSR
jgi:hypothetical protein